MATVYQFIEKITHKSLLLLSFIHQFRVKQVKSVIDISWIFVIYCIFHFQILNARKNFNRATLFFIKRPIYIYNNLPLLPQRVDDRQLHAGHSHVLQWIQPIRIISVRQKTLTAWFHVQYRRGGRGSALPKVEYTFADFMVVQSRQVLMFSPDFSRFSRQNFQKFPDIFTRQF